MPGGWNLPMIRKTVIAALATSAISSAILGWVGYVIPVYRGWQITGELHSYVYFGDGLARFYWLLGNDDIYLDSPDAYVQMEVRRAADDAVCIRYTHGRPGTVAPYALVSNRWNPQRGATTPSICMVGVRTRIWPPIAVFAAYPILTFGRDRYRRRVRLCRKENGQCVECGYDLTGLPEPRCPECGTKI